jgi:radical SAM superfamily enzyme YgiQ (UPF0313 family)
LKDNIVVVRPPSEANSFLLPVTIGCSNNTCTFCPTYKDVSFRLRDWEDIKEHIDMVARHYASGVRRVFLENGDAIAAPQEMLVTVLEYLKEKLPGLERVGTYAAPLSTLQKSLEDLKELKKLGLDIAYLGAESGDAEVLKAVKKGATPEQIIEAGRRLKQAGLTTSITVILGLGGVEGSKRHAAATGKLLTAIDPDYAAALTLMLAPGCPLYNDWREGRFKPISPMQSLVELKLIIENCDFTDCFFTANHASNYLPLRVRLPQQKEAVLKTLESVIASGDSTRLKPEYLRAM